MRRGSRRRSFRRRVGAVRRRGNKFTAVRIIKWAIALAPAGSDAFAKFQLGGGGAAGARLALSSIGESYTGYSIYSNTFNPSTMVRGYVPLLGAWLFGKIASRVIR